MTSRRKQKQKKNPEAPSGAGISFDRSEFAPRLNADDGAHARRAAVIHPRLPAPRSAAAVHAKPALRSADARLAEARGLAEAIGLDVAHAAVAPVTRIRPATLIGLGAVENVQAALEDAEAQDGAAPAEVVIIDAHLTPVQQRNLENAFGRKVIDRTGLILEIFGARARTREGRLQVELAALTYQRSRLVRSWTHLERQRGGLGFVGGPGETQIETDRRLIDERITRLKKDIAGVRKTRTLHRAARKRVPYPVVALAGYTNAGKSTLFNALTGADVRAEDQVFATLDPTLRGVRTPAGRTVIVSDTVGFVSDLPHELVEAFRATLEEVREADLILHVHDAAHPDADAQGADVDSVLDEIMRETPETGETPQTPETSGGGAHRAPRRLDVFNKIDAVRAEDLAVLKNRAGHTGVFVSALGGEGLENLLGAVDAALDASAGAETYDLTIAPEDGEGLAWIYRHTTVLRREDSPAGISLSARMTAPALARLERDFSGRCRIAGRPA